MPMGPPVWEMSPTGVTPILEFFFVLGEGFLDLGNPFFMGGAEPVP